MKNSNAMPIAWHEKNLVNRRESADRIKMEIERKHQELDRLLQENYLLEAQILEAKERGKTHFDAERFLIKRKTK